MEFFILSIENDYTRILSCVEMIKEYTATPMILAALFTIAKTWKQPKCPRMDEWIKKL